MFIVHLSIPTFVLEHLFQKHYFFSLITHQLLYRERLRLQWLCHIHVNVRSRSGLL